jgi:hypothetical protein
MVSSRLAIRLVFAAGALSFLLALASPIAAASQQLPSDVRPLLTPQQFKQRLVGTIEHFGIAQRYVRPPDTALSDDQMKEVKSFWDSLGVRPTD